MFLRLMQFCLLLTLCTVQLVHSSEQTLWLKLEQLDDLRATHGAQFTEQLPLLESELAIATRDEQNYFRLLEAYRHGLTGDLTEAYLTVKPLISPTTEENLRLRATAMATNVLVLSQQYLEAFHYLNELTTQLNDTHAPKTIEQASAVIALTLIQLSKFDDATFYIDTLQQQAESGKALCHASYLNVEVLAGKKLWRELEEKAWQAAEYCADFGENLYSLLILNKFHEMLIETERYEESVSFYQEQYENYQSTRYSALIAFTKALAANAYISLGEFSTAHELIQKAEALINIDETNQASQLIYQVKYLLAEAENNYQLALAAYKEFSRRQSDFRDDASAREQAFHLARAQVTAKNRQIELLNKDNLLLHLQQEVLSKEAQNARLLIGLFLVLFLAAGVLAYRGLTGRHRFKHLAEFDALTGISNRYHFNQLAEQSLSTCKQKNITMGVVMFDLDHFKQINDQFGHAVGDWVLQQVVNSCRNFMRLDDVFGRLGGEEFAILLPGCHADKALMLAEICRDAIEDIDTSASGHEFLLTASFGVTSSDSSGYDLKQLLADADAAMYHAKKQGRNQVHFFSGREAVNPSA
ncbi:GGDEF domain-containing protein [Alkalimonas collagenimarina]|uniref:diguanylate cyclase n=1 Tax=Alkalimonas collagenimarina TaxID=400390 RepID=A0ABT9GW48_9GAMM|nr:GGDEF domain-containing protein [Alkalimonas collagenimarina]MDP4535282.1 GGDEF domain-containing protein [Alkalimonas collagenimarina]